MVPSIGGHCWPLFYFCDQFTSSVVYQNETSGIKPIFFLMFPDVTWPMVPWLVVVYSWSRIKESTILYSNGFDYHLV